MTSLPTNSADDTENAIDEIFKWLDYDPKRYSKEDAKAAVRRLIKEARVDEARIAWNTAGGQPSSAAGLNITALLYDRIKQLSALPEATPDEGEDKK